MNTRDIEQVRERLEAGYREKLRAVEAEHKQNLEAYERLKRAMVENSNGSTQSAQVHGPRVRSLNDAVKAVIPYVQGKFDINVIIRLIHERHPEIKTPINPTSISGILRSLEKIEELKLVKRGAGKRPSIYQVPRSDARPRGAGTR